MVSNGSIFLSFGCAGSSLLCKLSLVAARGLLSSSGVVASHCGAFSCVEDRL